jgi:enoyl-CoA hydratase
MSAVLFDIEGPIAYLTLNRPEKRNAINDAMRDRLEEILRDIDADDSISVAIIRGAGPSFCSGYDLTAIPGAGGYGPSSRTNSPRPSIAQDRERLRKSIERWAALWNFRKPIIAQVHGHCIAGGGELAAMCDLTYCAEDALFGHPAGRAIGIPMTLALWPLKLGAMRTKELLFTGDLVDGREAVRIGIANRCFPKADLESEVKAIAGRIALVPIEALSIHKHVVNRWLEIIGVRTCMAEGAEFNSIFHESASAREFAEISRQQGLKAALDWRDSPFDDKSS